MVEYIIENVTKDELDILDREGFEWYPDWLDSDDIVIEGDVKYYEMALHAIRRI